MKKDYLAVDDALADVDESRFVAEYWSTVWRDHADPDLSALADREEFRLMQPFLARLAPGSRILDAGCGQGAWTLFLRQRGFETVGLDLSAPVIELLQRQFPDTTFACGDLRATGFADGTFDALFSWGAFEHFEDGLGACLDEAHRVLKPGGWLFISVPFDNWRTTLRTARPLARWDEDFDPRAGYRQRHRFYQWRFTRPELTRELELRGFRSERVVPISKAQGVGRWLTHDVGLRRRESLLFRALRRVGTAVLPAGYVSHMLMGIARRR